MWARTFASRLSRTCRSRSGSPTTSTGSGASSSICAPRIERPRGLDGLAGDLAQLDRLALERPSLVEPGEQQQVVDEQPHPPRLALDAGHRPLEIVRPLACAAVEELRVGAHGRERRAQLVRRVRDEPAQPLLRGGALVERLLDLAEHRVQRPSEPADLGARIVVLDALREVAARDRRRRVLDPPERPQADADEPEAEHEDRGEHRERDDDLDQEQLVQGVVDLVERRRDDERLPAPERLELHPEARSARSPPEP